MRKVEEAEDSKEGILEGDVKPETKDEESGCDSDDNATCKNVPPGEETDVRDVIYQLESLSCITCVFYHMIKHLKQTYMRVQGKKEGFILRMLLVTSHNLKSLKSRFLVWVYLNSWHTLSTTIMDF